MRIVNIAVLASGKGSNFEAIVNAQRRGQIRAEIKLLLVDKVKAFARQKAKRLGVREIFLSPKDYPTSLEFDRAAVKILKSEKIDLVVLAGYLRILSPYFIKKYKNRILNIHPALLPSFKGIDSIQRAFEYGCKITGVTVHLVDEKVDHGPIILQEPVWIKKGMSLELLDKKIHHLEHKLYPLAIRLFIQKKLKIKGRNVSTI